MKFSIIIPTFNSGKYIKACLDSVFALDYPNNKFEVIVVDGGSKDETLNILKNYPVNVVNSKNISISNSRNLGAKSAKGENLVFIDSDCLINKKLLKKSETHLKNYACCGSFYKPAKEHGWVSRAWLFVENKKWGLVDWVPAGTLVLQKDVFEDIKGFNESLTTQEDFDFCLRLKERGYVIYNDKTVSSIHLGQTDNLKDFFKKEIWRGDSLIKSIKAHGILKEEIISTSLIFYYFFAFCILILSLFLFNLNLIVISLVLIILPPFFLASRKVAQTKKISYFFKFYILILLYQIARTVSLVRHNQFKDLF